MTFIEIITNTTTLGAEMVSAIYDMHGATGCVIEDKDDIIKNAAIYGDWDYIADSVIGNMPDEVQVKAYFDKDAKDILKAIEKKIEELKNMTEFDLGSLDVEIKKVDDKDWENEWKKYYKSFEVGERIIVRPYWEEVIESERQQITIDPGMAFGNGTHETTYMCLELIEKHIKGTEFAYDVGCGTGILAVAAVLLGAEKAVAIDRDSVAVSVAQHNIELNNLQDRIETKIGDLLNCETQKAQMILANIIADIIIPFSKTAYKMLETNGIFIASGIIKIRADETINAIKSAGFKVLDIRKKGEWTSVAGIKDE